MSTGNNRPMFLTPQLPPGLFLLVTDGGAADARLRGDDVVLADEATNTWLAVPEAGTPRWFRIRRQQGNEIWAEDGDGAVTRLTIVPGAYPSPASV
jgi:hypothetical protein